jgi:outer membrane protein TolC
MRCSLKALRTLIPILGVALWSVVELPAQTTTPSPTPSISLPGSQSPFQGSAAEGKATGEVLQIDFKDAIDRGLRNNLGLLLAGDQTETARGERWKELSDLLPNLSAHIIENAQNQSLAALGFNKLAPFFGAGSGGWPRHSRGSGSTWRNWPRWPTASPPAT